MTFTVDVFVAYTKPYFYLSWSDIDIHNYFSKVGVDGIVSIGALVFGIGFLEAFDVDPDTLLFTSLGLPVELVDNVRFLEIHKDLLRALAALCCALIIVVVHLVKQIKRDINQIHRFDTSMT